MNILEQRVMTIIGSTLPSIAKELERANRLKALELTIRLDMTSMKDLTPLARDQIASKRRLLRAIMGEGKEEQEKLQEQP